MALERFRASPLPNPPLEYDPQYVRQLIRVLENYFSQLDGKVANYAQSYRADNFYGGTFSGTFSGSGLGLAIPFNQFTSSSDQTASSVGTAYPLTYTTDDFPGDISVVSSSRITPTNAGVYRFDFSVVVENNTNAIETIDIWFRKKGTDVANSNSQFSIPARKSAGVFTYVVAVTPYMARMAADDYMEIMWRVSNTGVSIQHLPAVTANPGVTPAIPASPSVIVTVEFMSE